MREESPPPALPELRQRVHVRLVRWAVSLASIVEEVTDQEIVLDAPTDLGEGQEPTAGERLLVTWEDQSGPHTLACSFDGVILRAGPHWRLAPDGVATDDQRRRHVRTATEASATIVRDQQVMGATVLDVSEGGLRCRLDDPGAIAGVGELLGCAFTVTGEDLDLRGKVVQVHLEPGEPRILALSFVDLTGHEADELRRHVFAEQTRVRARSIR